MASTFLTQLPTQQEIDAMQAGPQFDRLIGTLTDEWFELYNEPVQARTPRFSTNRKALDGLMIALHITDPCLRLFGPFHMGPETGDQVRALGGWYHRGTERPLNAPFELILIGNGATFPEAACKVIAKAIVLAYTYYNLRKVA